LYRLAMTNRGQGADALTAVGDCCRRAVKPSWRW
jgi:hypothetical protein